MRKGLPVYNINALKEDAVSHRDLIANDFRHYQEVHPDLHFPHKHSFYHLVYFTAGKGHHSIDFEVFPVRAGQIYFMIPGQVHGWDFEGMPDGYIVNFSTTYLQTFLADAHYLNRFSFFSGKANEQVIDVPQEERAIVDRLLRSVVVEAASDHAFRNDYIRMALVQLFIVISRCSKADGPVANGYQSALLTGFIQLIDQYYKEKRLPSEYAALLYVTPNHLNALCKDLTGSAAGELIRQRVVLEAKRLLVNADMSIAEIAHELGFHDNSYFTRFFKRAEGLAPDAFRDRFIKHSV